MTTQPYQGDPDWPVAFNGCRITGTFIDFSSRPVQGYITVQPTIAAVMVGGKIVVSTPIRFDLDENGKVEVVLPATNDPDVNPNGWKYRVVENFTGIIGRTYEIDALVGTTVDLVAISPGG